MSNIRVINLEDYELGFNEVLYKIDETNLVFSNPFSTGDEEKDYENYKKNFYKRFDEKDEDLRRELDRLYNLYQEKDIALGFWGEPGKLSYSNVILDFLEQFLYYN